MITSHFQMIDWCQYILSYSMSKGKRFMFIVHSYKYFLLFKFIFFAYDLIEYK